jgi:hypothetical protein
MFVRFAAMFLLLASLAGMLSACGSQPQPELGQSQTRFQSQIKSIPYPSTSIGIDQIDSYIDTDQPEVLRNRIVFTTGTEYFIFMHEQSGSTITKVTTQTHTPLGSTDPMSVTALLSNVKVDQFAAVEITLRDMKVTMADCDNFQIVSGLDRQQGVTWVVFATCAETMSYTIDAQTGAILSKTQIK